MIIGDRLDLKQYLIDYPNRHDFSSIRSMVENLRYYGEIDTDKFY